ncbi:hypothetical protein NDA10_007311 [Ustilago hordei]|nr:hypothetical protein NDA10_007311 [Ustilago hordei]UTT88751.1 hypothetical protein NDA17_007192 [Ustilago hordei]
MEVEDKGLVDSGLSISLLNPEEGFPPSLLLVDSNQPAFVALSAQLHCKATLHTSPAIITDVTRSSNQLTPRRKIVTVCHHFSNRVAGNFTQASTGYGDRPLSELNMVAQLGKLGLGKGQTKSSTEEWSDSPPRDLL